MTPQAKATLFRDSGALAVDMESHLAAAFAKRQGLPFAVARAVSDPANRALPPLAAKAVRPDGSVDISYILRELRREPHQLAGLIAAGLNSRAAFATLARCGPLIGPLLRLAL